MQPFSTARWIWSREQSPNAYVLFAKDLALPGERVRVRISASYHYELYINGDFVARGPVHGDPAWCQYDEWTYKGGAIPFTWRYSSTIRRRTFIICSLHLPD